MQTLQIKTAPAPREQIVLLWSGVGYPLAPGEYMVTDGKVRILSRTDGPDGVVYSSWADVQRAPGFSVADGAKSAAFSFPPGALIDPV